MVVRYRRNAALPFLASMVSRDAITKASSLCLVTVQVTQLPLLSRTSGRTQRRGSGDREEGREGERKVEGLLDGLFVEPSSSPSC